jgi:RNA polymerase sigma-70 factor (ECF subfamily)
VEPQAEQELIERCREGDPRAWDDLFDAHYDAACRFIFQLASDFSREDAEEICQEAFVTVVRNLGSFKGRSRFQTWFFRIAANKARDFRDKRNAAKRGGGQIPLSLDAEDPETGLKIDKPSGKPGPDDNMISLEDHAFIGEALDALGDNCREIIQLRYFGDLSYEEISQELDLNKKTVSSRLSKCLDKLEALTKAIFARDNSDHFPSNP